MKAKLLLPLIMMANAPAHAEENTAPPASAYRQVMQAQYGAEAAPSPMRPEEAERVYDSYLRSLGQAAGGQTREQAGDRSMESGGAAGIPAH